MFLFSIGREYTGKDGSRWLLDADSMTKDGETIAVNHFYL
jgi:hypothetical protein